MESRKIRERILKGELKTKTKEGKKSSVWQRFSEVVRLDGSSAGYVICNACEALYVFDSHKTGTSNMVHHSCSKTRTLPCLTNAINPIARRETKISIPLDVRSKFVDDCVDMCCRDIRPFDVFTGRGFVQVAQTLINIGAKYGAVDAEAILPDFQTLGDRAQRQAAECREKLQHVLQRVMEGGGVAVTPDMCRDASGRMAYTVLTCHYVTDRWQLESRTLAAVEFDSNQKTTNEIIRDKITSVLMNHGIPAERVVFVGDLVPSIRSALRAYRWVPCASHTLNTVLRETFSRDSGQEGITDLVDVLDNCRSLVEFLKRVEAVRNLSHTVLQEWNSRWSSKVLMLESVLRHYSVIIKLLEDRDQLHRMVGISEEQLVHLVAFLTIFRSAVDELEGDKYPTIQTVLLWFFKLKKHCEPKFGDPSYMILIRARASSLLQEKMRLTPIHKVATFLCPRFKSLKMLTPGERKEVILQVRALLNEEPSGGQLAGVTTAPLGLGRDGLVCGRPKKQKMDFTEWEDEAPRFKDEVEEYCSTNFQFEESLEENLLCFWDKQNRSFPRLQRLARRILCIPATTVVNEAVRNRLNPGTVDPILFLNSAKK